MAPSGTIIINSIEEDSSDSENTSSIDAPTEGLVEGQFETEEDSEVDYGGIYICKTPPPKGKPAARQFDQTKHGGWICEGVPTVLVDGRPAACISHNHLCPIPYHVGGNILPRLKHTILIGGKPAARVGDKLLCVGGGQDEITSGSNTLFLGDHYKSFLPKKLAHNLEISKFKAVNILLQKCLADPTVKGNLYTEYPKIGALLKHSSRIEYTWDYTDYYVYGGEGGYMNIIPRGTPYLITFHKPSGEYGVEEREELIQQYPVYSNEGSSDGPINIQDMFRDTMKCQCAQNEIIDDLRIQWTKSKDDPIKEQTVRHKIHDLERGYGSRGIKTYPDILGENFFEQLSQCDSKQHIIEIGPAQFPIVEEAYLLDNSYNSQKLAKQGIHFPPDKAKFTAIGLEQSNQAHDYLAEISNGKYDYKGECFLELLQPGEIEPADVVFDQFAAFTYTNNLAKTTEGEIGLLKINGVFFTHMENFSQAYTHIKNQNGEDVRLEWLRAIHGATVTVNKETHGTSDRMQIIFKRTGQKISAPPLKLVEYEYGDPPKRIFLWENSPKKVRLPTPEELAAISKDVIADVTNNPEITGRIWGAHFEALAMNPAWRPGLQVGRLFVNVEDDGKISYTCPVGNRIEIDQKTGQYQVFLTHYPNPPQLVHQGVSEEVKQHQLTIIHMMGEYPLRPEEQPIMERQIRAVLSDIKKTEAPKAGNAFIALLRSPVKADPEESVVGQFLVKTDAETITARCPVGIVMNYNPATGEYQIFKSDFDQINPQELTPAEEAAEKAKFLKRTSVYQGKIPPNHLQ